MEVEEAAGARGVPQAAGRELPEYPATNKVDAMAVQNASGSLEIMGQLVLNEWELLRRKIREFGAKIRQMSSKVATVTVKRLWNQLLSLLRRHGNTIPKQFELDASLILNEMEKERERPPPRDTLADIRRVLLEDIYDEGVILKKSMPAWRAMPPKRRNVDVGSPMREGDTSAYQLFNRPMTVADDDFDRLSLPSTHFAQSESEKIMGLEAQLSMLTRQLNILMTNGMPQHGGGGSQKSSRTVSRSGSRASLYQQQMNANPNSSFGVQPSYHHQSSSSLRHQPPHSPTHSSDSGSLYANDDSASSYASPSHTKISLMQPLLPLHHSITVAGRRDSMIMTGDATSTIPPPPPLPPFGLHSSASSTELQQGHISTLGKEGGGSSSDSTLRVNSPTSCTLVPYHGNGDEDGGKEVEVEVEGDDDDLSFSLPPPPPAIVQKELQRVNIQESALSSFSFLDDINRGNFALKKMSSEKSPSDSLRSSTSGEETEQDENNAGPLVKPSMKDLVSRKESLKKVSADRSPGGTPVNRGRGRRPSLGQDGGRTLYTGEYLAAALAKKFDSIRTNEEDDDQSVTAGDQSWLDD